MFTAQRRMSNAVEEGLYAHRLGVRPQRSRNHKPSFIHNNLMLLVCLDDCRTRLGSALGGR